MQLTLITRKVELTLCMYSSYVRINLLCESKNEGEHSHARKYIRNTFTTTKGIILVGYIRICKWHIIKNVLLFYDKFKLKLSIVYKKVNNRFIFSLFVQIYLTYVYSTTNYLICGICKKSIVRNICGGMSKYLF